MRLPPHLLKHFCIYGTLYHIGSPLAITFCCLSKFSPSLTRQALLTFRKQLRYCMQERVITPPLQHLFQLRFIGHLTMLS